jgi:hypothetical protein
MILDRIPYTTIKKWKKLIGEDKLDEIIQNITIRILQNKGIFDRGDSNYKSDINDIIKILKDILSSMDIEKSEKKRIIEILQNEINSLPEGVLQEKSPYSKQIISKYFLVSKKYPFDSIKKYKSNKKYMSMLSSGK